MTPVTVRQLICALQDYPDQEAEVLMEGCDCYQEASGYIELLKGALDEKPQALLRSVDSMQSEHKH